MAGTEESYHLTKEDIKKAESKSSNAHGGSVPAGSNAAIEQVCRKVSYCIALVNLTNLPQSMVDKADQNKADIIAERQGNLPLPEQPPKASDFNSGDASTVNVGSGRFAGGVSYGNDALNDNTSAESAARVDGNAFKANTAGQGVGREAVEGLGGLPDDAVARGAKGKAGLAETTNKDTGYPQKNDPADTSKMP